MQQLLRWAALSGIAFALVAVASAVALYKCSEPHPASAQAIPLSAAHRSSCCIGSSGAAGCLQGTEDASLQLMRGGYEFGAIFPRVRSRRRWKGRLRVSCDCFKSDNRRIAPGR